MNHSIIRMALIVALTIAALAGFTTDRAAAQDGIPGMVWSVEYYNNMDLTGAPYTTLQLPSVGFNWTDTAPVSGIAADIYSIRYTGIAALNGGTYMISTRADDGVRIYINGVLLLNEWHISSGITYVRQFQSIAGQNTIVVEYFENTGVAFLSFALQPVDVVPPPPPPTNATATVTAYYLNVRSAPSAYTGARLTVISRNQTFPIIGRTANSSWWQISANGLIGWVHGGYVNAQNTANVPITDGTAPPANYTAVASGNLNIRSGP
ncbi:MAG: SH3 domain-containing protein, partial [Anaerolineae bacterium]|nr:SH3 domain-containing protein [Anaerolineae bacterium]